MECEEALVKTTSVPQYWVDYTWFNKNEFSSINVHQKNNIIGWMRQYGTDYFAPLAIWHIDWLNVLRNHYTD